LLLKPVCYFFVGLSVAAPIWTCSIVLRYPSSLSRAPESSPRLLRKQLVAMAFRSAPRSKSAAPGLVILAGLVVALVHLGSLGPAYSVKGAWQGQPSTLKDTVKGDFGTVMEGLEPKVNFPPISYHREGVALSVENGRLNADYTTNLDGDTMLQLRVNDEQEWKASLLGEDASLRVRGQGKDLDSLFWEASQSSSVDDVGDVKVEFNSDREYNLTVVREILAKIAGAELDAKVRATNAGVTGRLGARRELPGGVEASYSVENPVGVYDLASSTHRGRLSAPVAGGEAVLRVEGDASSQAYETSYARELQGGQAAFRMSRKDGALGYNVSYARNFENVLDGAAGVHVGIDEDGVYGKLSAGREVGQGLDANYEASARFETGEDRRLRLQHALKLSNKLGYAQFAHGSGEAPKLRVGYEFNA